MFEFVTLGSLDNYTFVVIVTINENGKVLLSRKKNLNTWEFQGGHIEDGESPLEAAERELFEEAGIKHANILPIYDYYTFEEDTHCCRNNKKHNKRNGIIFLAKVGGMKSTPKPPDNMMEEVKFFSGIPDNMTYFEMSKWIEKNVILSYD